MLCLALGILLLMGCSRPPIEIPTGTFYGTLPCADCPGIRYELTLNDDGTYVEQTEYLEKSVTVRRRFGYLRSAAGHGGAVAQAVGRRHEPLGGGRRKTPDA